MGGISVWQLIIIAVSILLIVANFKIIGKTGFSKWWGLVSFIPVVNFISLWVLASIRWPNDE